MLAARCPPDSKMTVPKEEGLVAECAAGEIAGPEILAACIHRIFPLEKTALVFCPDKI